MAKKQHKVEWLGRGWLPICIGICVNEAAFWKEIKRGGLDPKDVGPWVVGNGATTHHVLRMWGKHNESVSLVTIDLDKTIHGHKLSSVAALLAHEFVHVKQFAGRVMREETFSSETEAYMVQMWVGQALHWLIRTHKPKFKPEK